MWSTKDLTMVVSLAVVGLVLTLIVVQSASMITGIPGANAVFTVILATLTVFLFLCTRVGVEVFCSDDDFHAAYCPYIFGWVAL
jgi:hypothetical protein